MGAVSPGLSRLASQRAIGATSGSFIHPSAAVAIVLSTEVIHSFNPALFIFLPAVIVQRYFSTLLLLPALLAPTFNQIYHPSAVVVVTPNFTIEASLIHSR